MALPTLAVNAKIMRVVGLNQVRPLYCVVFALAFFLLPYTLRAELTGRDYAIELTANIADNPPEISVIWSGDQNARAYTIRRKLRDETSWRDIGTAEGPSTGFKDRDIQVGTGYEYQVVKDSAFGIQAYGYIYSGINLPLVDERGTVIVLAEEKLAHALDLELLRLEFDLIGDGWKVERATVSATNRPPEVKAKIQSIYYKDPANTRALFLFGHVPVPYSGNIMPDGHTNHMGAWPADVYYADLDGPWTDLNVDSRVAELLRNQNVPGDGKFDQDHPPSSVELLTGRVDLSNLTCFLNKTPSRSELDLARQYLEKDHRFRVGAFPVSRRAIIFDQIESKTAEPVSAMAWRNFSPLVGREIEQINPSEYFAKVSASTYLWSAVTAAGSYTSSYQVGTADAFALYDANVVFTTFLGSYYGDWDVESAFLRAALGGRGTLLTTVYSGQPQWLFHPMGLGEIIGYSAKITQENNKDGIYPPHNNGAGEVHTTLLGDPTLRAYPVPSVLNLKGEANGDGMVVGWQIPQIEGFVGCLVYTAPSPKGPYHRVTPNPVSGSFYRLPGVPPTDTVMVKAVALTRTPSGSFYNASVGVFYPDPLAAADTQPPAAPFNLGIAKVSSSSITLTWVESSPRISGFRIERKDPGAAQFREIASSSGDNFTFIDNSLAVPGLYTYRVRAFNPAGSSPFSSEAVATTLAGSAEFVGIDAITQGNYIGSYGNQGLVIPGFVQQLPPACTLSTSNLLLYSTAFVDDVRGVQRTNSASRSANCWFNITPLALHLNFTDDAFHQLALYLSSWGRVNPSWDFEVLDAVSGVSLDRRNLTSVNEGIYVVYNVRRQVYVRITPPFNTNAEIYGIFLDPASIATPKIQPAQGPFLGRALIDISCATPGADLFYTLDGSPPTPQSARYSGPFWLHSTTRVTARAFRDGFPPSAAAEAEYQNTLPNLVGIISWDTETGGNWPNKYGTEGYSLPSRDAALPSFVELSLEGADPWTWSDQTDDPHALLSDKTGDLRQARAWYGDAITLHANVYDTNLHALSLYFLDYDSGSRAQKIELLGSDGTLRDKFTLDSFQSGRYLTLGIQGEIQIRITRTDGPNALLSGIFLDPAPPALSFNKPAPLTGLEFSNGLLVFSTPAFPGMRICTDRSVNLRDWECYMTNTVTSATARINTFVDPFGTHEFFRTHFVP
jgi:hypothetical protein